MYIFIAHSLILGLLVEQESTLYLILRSEWLCYLGGFIMLISFLANLFKFKRFSFHLYYDLYATGALFVWYAYWPSFFTYSTPIFKVLPLYFTVLTALSSLFFIKSRNQIDPDALVWLQWLSDSGRFHPLWIMLGLAASLFMTQHFLIFPVMLTLFIIRFALACCLDKN